MSSLKKLLGQRIRELRQQKNLKQYELARKVDFDPNYISRIEIGVSSPSLEAIEKIAKALQIEPKELFDIGHFESKQRLLMQIESQLAKVDVKNLQLIYKLLNELQ